ncbi:GntR family transcriptional regulator [Mammaliicoccus lentus]|uniref:GntR family transcriptional regulator n=1 Tax=Mammaliicoccus lentus TaxID=42858 RepID=UPI001072C424|nr:GntR family transcriptional regulator [Mammaliicoccus lentus]MBF0795418.1 GntR family transcriptional regulator [Mammaliicoccus lentus]TFV14258.1 GntR family transcriptional regulator [Mammaliicoccus lentus]
MAEPKYKLIAFQLKDKIINNEYEYGKTIPSEKKLQEQYNVSRYTIRQAIDLLVQDGYIIKKKGLGSIVSDNYLKKTNHDTSTKKIGVIVTYLSDYIFPSIIRGIEKILGANGYSLILASTNNTHAGERRCLEMMIEQGVQGLIVEPTKSNVFNPNLSFYSLLKSKEIPVLMINACYEELNIPYISIDDTKSGFLATSYLLDEGHDDIVLITKIDDMQGKFRMKGYIEAFEDKGAIFKGENIFTYTTETKDKVLDLIINELLNHEINPTAFVCYNDDIAYSFIKRLKENGKCVPDDYSVVGEDNSILSQLEDISLTTTSHPQENLGVEAARWMIKAINSGQIGETTIMDTEIIIRNSVKKRNA